MNRQTHTQGTQESAGARLARHAWEEHRSASSLRRTTRCSVGRLQEKRPCWCTCETASLSLSLSLPPSPSPSKKQPDCWSVAGEHLARIARKRKGQASASVPRRNRHLQSAHLIFMNSITIKFERKSGTFQKSTTTIRAGAARKMPSPLKEPLPKPLVNHRPVTEAANDLHKQTMNGTIRVVQGGVGEEASRGVGVIGPALCHGSLNSVFFAGRLPLRQSRSRSPTPRLWCRGRREEGAER